MAEYNDTEEMNLSTLSKVREKTCVLSHKENKKLVSSFSLLSDSFGPKRKGSYLKKYFIFIILYFSYLIILFVFQLR